MKILLLMPTATAYRRLVTLRPKAIGPIAIGLAQGRAESKERLSLVICIRSASADFRQDVVIHGREKLGVQCIPIEAAVKGHRIDS